MTATNKPVLSWGYNGGRLIAGTSWLKAERGAREPFRLSGAGAVSDLAAGLRLVLGAHATTTVGDLSFERDGDQICVTRADGELLQLREAAAHELAAWYDFTAAPVCRASCGQEAYCDTQVSLVGDRICYLGHHLVISDRTGLIAALTELVAHRPDRAKLPIDGVDDVRFIPLHTDVYAFRVDQPPQSGNVYFTLANLGKLLLLLGEQPC